MLDIDFDASWLAGKGLSRERGRSLLRLLGELSRSASLREAAAAAGLSYRFAWGILGDGAHLLGGPLVDMQRGRAARLSALGRQVLAADERVRKAIGTQLESLRAELPVLLASGARARETRLVVHGSHDLALEALRTACQPHLELDLVFRGADDSLADLARGECDLAGFHVADALPRAAAAAAALGRWLDPRKHALLNFVTREQGLIARPGARIRGVHDLARPGVRFIHRSSGSAARAIEGPDASVAAAVASGRADAGFGLHADAARFRLAFVPLSVERYFFACAKSALRKPALKTIRQSLRSAAFAQGVARLAGYDLTRTARLEPLEAALTWVGR